MEYSASKRKLREMSDLVSVTPTLKRVTQRFCEREENSRPSSNVAWDEDIELVAGMPTKISARTKITVEESIRRDKADSLVTKRLTTELFTPEELSASNCLGHGDRPALDVEKVAAIRTFIVNAFLHELTVVFIFIWTRSVRTAGRSILTFLCRTVLYLYFYPIISYIIVLVS